MTLVQATGAPPAADVPPLGGASRARWRLIICLAVVVAALGWIAVRGLTGSFVYYLSPTEVVTQHQAVPGQRVRLGRYVVPGPVHPPPHQPGFTGRDGPPPMAGTNP